MCAALADRARIGAALGNDSAVEYPHGVDLTLRDTLDALRTFLVEVRIELRVGGETVFQDGHVRLVSDMGDDGFPLYWVGSLGLYSNPDDWQPRTTLEADDYWRVASIMVIDRLLIGRGAPRIVWRASSERVAKFEAERANQDRREERLAILLLVHVAVVVGTTLGGCVPALVAWHRGNGAAALGWGLVWFFVSVIVGSTLGCWETFPSLSSLWRARGGNR